MEHETHNHNTEISEGASVKRDYTIPASIVVSAIILAGAWTYNTGLKAGTVKQQSANVVEGFEVARTALEEAVLPSRGVTLPVIWGDLGSKLVSAGAIDATKFKAIYGPRFTKEYEVLLSGESNGKLRITNDNAGYVLNLFWALGLAQKNQILETGEMVNPQYGGAQNFASTGGWTVARGDAMEHYSKHMFFTLTADQQAMVDKVSRNIYRPCCGNSTNFPDCNHGMAMLGLLELMASQGVSEQDMYAAALSVNSYWFPDTHLTIATYMKSKGVEWNNVDAKEMLGATYSSASGYRNIASKVTVPASGSQSGGGCAVSGEQPTPAPQPRREQSGCGIN